MINLLLLGLRRPKGDWRLLGIAGKALQTTGSGQYQRSTIRSVLESTPTTVETNKSLLWSGRWRKEGLVFSHVYQMCDHKEGKVE